MRLGFELVAEDPTGARAGILHTRRGPVETPIFMPVATHANIRNVAPAEIGATGARILLANTYHLLLRPGPEVFQRVGGIQRFMNWDGLVLTDSGGYQIYSLPGDRVIDEKGALFRSYHDNRKHLLSPEVSVRTQQAIGSDIMMVLDVCIDARSGEADARAAMERTHRWALRSLATARETETGQALFAIVQGGTHEKLRRESAAFLTSEPFDGFAIGGLAVGEGREETYATAALTASLLPRDRPRYLMGVGTPQDLIECVRGGVDMFDCIIPTKMAQQGYAYTSTGKLRLKRQEFVAADGPLEEGCPCPACTGHSRGYLQHLCGGKHSYGSRLLALHNLHHYGRLMRRMREAILAGTFASVREEMYAALAA